MATAGRDALEPFVPSALEQDRRAFRRRQSGRSIAIAAASTVVFAALVALALAATPGWERVRDQFLDVEVAIQAAPRVLEGLWLNVRVLLVAAVLTAVASVLLATVRTLPGPIFFPLRFLAAAYTDVFRGMPLLVLLYIVGFGIPGLRLVETRIPMEVLGTVALVLTYSAYVSEVLRAGIQAVHPSQLLAARGLGLSRGTTLRRVVLPQALRNVSPALMNDFVSMQKDVGLISVLGAVDAIRAAQIETSTYADFTPYVLAGLLFVVLAWPTIRLTDHLSARMRERERTAVVA